MFVTDLRPTHPPEEPPPRRGRTDTDPSGSPDPKADPTADGTPTRTRWCAGTRLLVTAGALWTVFLALHLLLTDRWWRWLVVEATPPVAFLVIPLLLLAATPLARPVRRWLAPALLIHVLIGAHLTGYGPAWRGPDTAAAQGAAVGEEITVFSWNADYWDMDDDPDAFHAYLREQDADVYLLQEYLHWEDEDPILIDDTERLREEFPEHEIVVEGELITLSRLPVVAVHHRSVPDRENAWYWEGRKTQRTDVLVGDTTLSLYNSHLPVPFRVGDNPLSERFHSFLANQFDWRTRELDWLREDLADNPHPALITGDFNSPWMGSLIDLGPGVRTHTPEGRLLPATTWPIADYPLPRLWRLDWLFTSGDLTLTGYRLGGGAEFSDHRAQEIRLLVP
ncbi:endonuclease/exonuclease/phosphatase family protein [Streptomyces alkaliphilus]|uniref:endonuclease/exonuclease/phosphatase family protein n=1 Tax=Streptomyces alkaliphilus TaxID=1472722 RepID=UPI00117E4E85|nr:endonuclease/exonuclease/phosphatase family protein [Streptomyces alkaliphilus]MQS09309.1 endonuclease [Streptomyces alkaliphilus]